MAIATTSTASFCQSFNRLRKFITSMSLSDDLNVQKPSTRTGHPTTARSARALSTGDALGLDDPGPLGDRSCQLAETVTPHQLLQRMRFGSHGLGGGSGLSDETRVLLSQLVHLQHGLVDLRDAQ